VSAALGSDFARRHLTNSVREKLLAVMDANHNLFKGKCLYAEYLRCLSLLVMPPAQKVPEFMTSETWRIKNCQTVLSSWVQARHTFVLQTKKVMSYDNGGGSVVRGLVEPNPEFYRRLRRLAKRTQESLRRAGALRLGFGRLELQLQELIRITKFLKSVKGWKSRSPQEKAFLKPLRLRLFAIHAIIGWDFEGDKTLPALVHLLDAVEREELPDDRSAVSALERLDVPVEMQWTKLLELCEGLEQLANKQLNGEKFDEHDDQFVLRYGDNLAAVLLYEEHAASEPSDDALRIVEVLAAHVSFSNTISHFHVAVGRPRAIYVLYPYQGKEVLCRGAVLPYFEFTHETPLTDAEWKTLYDSPQRPKQPGWLKPLFAP
jgi:hypothetical protein